MEMDSLDAMIDYVNANDKPLALYVFASNREIERVCKHTSSGGVCANDTVLQITCNLFINSDG